MNSKTPKLSLDALDDACGGRNLVSYDFAWSGASQPAYGYEYPIAYGQPYAQHASYPIAPYVIEEVYEYPRGYDRSYERDFGRGYDFSYDRGYATSPAATFINAFTGIVGAIANASRR